jgi:intracellular multiplication protein IcmJ
MSLKPLFLAAKKESWRPEGLYESRRESWKKVRSGILDRDQNRCVFCAFDAPEYQEVHHINGDHDDDSPDNLECACPLCHATQHLGLAGMQRKGELIYLPEISQVELNWMVRWLALGPYGIPSYEAYMLGPKTTLLDLFHHRRDVCQKRLGTSSPVELANAFLRMSDESYENARTTVLTPIRLFPGVFPDEGKVELLSGYDENIKHAWQNHLLALVPEPSRVPTYLQAFQSSHTDETE